MGNNKNASNLEICKLIVSAIIPIIVVLFGFLLSRSATEVDSKKKYNENFHLYTVERRLAVYDQIKLPLNNIYCYIEMVCDWREYSAQDIKNHRRYIQKIMYSNKGLWSEEEFELFMYYLDHIAFQASGPPHMVKIRAEINRERNMSSKWRVRDKVVLTGEKSPENKVIYTKLIRMFFSAS